MAAPSPYTRLLSSIKEWVYKARNPKKIEMYFIDFKNIAGDYDLRDLYERTLAAKALGYRVEVEVYEDTGNGTLSFVYVADLPAVPVKWEY